MVQSFLVFMASVLFSSILSATVPTVIRRAPEEEKLEVAAGRCHLQKRKDLRSGKGRDTPGDQEGGLEEVGEEKYYQELEGSRAGIMSVQGTTGPGVPQAMKSWLESTGVQEVSLAPGEAKGFDHPPWLSSCKSIYLDVGSNLGVQIRKFFEPDKYPDAPVLPLFKSTFGNGQVRTEANSSNCCLGIEPNPIHWKHLKSIELNYTKKGWHVHFYPYAAWKSEGTMSFVGHEEDVGHASWGAHLDYNTRAATSSDTQVRTVDLAAFIKSLPDHSVKLMKLDIEGAEYETVSHMISEKVLCQTTVEKTFMEVHSWGEITTWRDKLYQSEHQNMEAMQRHVKGTACNDNTSPTTLVMMDDETYLLDDGQRRLQKGRERLF